MPGEEGKRKKGEKGQREKGEEEREEEGRKKRKGERNKRARRKKRIRDISNKEKKPTVETRFNDSEPLKFYQIFFFAIFIIFNSGLKRSNKIVTIDNHQMPKWQSPSIEMSTSIEN